MLIRTSLTVSGETPATAATERSDAPGCALIASTTRNRIVARFTGRARSSRPTRDPLSD